MLGFLCSFSLDNPTNIAKYGGNFANNDKL